MPGIFSRPPFADSVTYSPNLLKPITWSQNDEASGVVGRIRDRAGEFYARHNPLMKEISEIGTSFERTILVPLQIDGYFMVDMLENNFPSQFDFLVYVLEKTPSNIAVIATQYKGRNGLGKVLSNDQIVYLSNIYSNFIYLKSSESIPYCSQYIAPYVDGVIGLSSSIIAQFALWKKPALVFGESHVSEFATTFEYSAFIDQIKIRNTIDRDTKLESYLSLSQVLMKDILEDASSALGIGRERKINLENMLNEMDFESAISSQPNPVRECYSDIISLESKGCSVVSFDIFDTLLVRTYAHPTDVFKVVGARFADQLGITASLFSTYRQNAERKAFQKAIAASRGEITLQQIYVELADTLGVDMTEIDKIAQYEAYVEQECLMRREGVCSAFDRLKAQGKQIILVSDMYLPSEVLRAALEKNKITGYKKLYLSCEVGLKKHSGKLFDHVLEELQVAPQQVLHIGDNDHGDIKMAKERGINTVHVPRPWQIFENSSLYKDIWSATTERHEPDLKRVLAVIANDEFSESQSSNSWFNGDAKKLGYFGLGPLLFDYTNWLIRTSMNNGVKKLFFLARDGKIMKEAYDFLASSIPDAPKSEYLLCSRRAVNVANLVDRKAVERLLEIEYTTGTLAAYIEGRFGIVPHKIPKNLLVENGFELNTSVGSSTKIDIKPFVRALTPLILQNAAEERELYLKYLEEIGFSGSNIAVVDIGYAGTMQESLAALAGLNHLSGYYVVTFRPALERMRRARLSFHGYLGNFIDRHDTTQLWARHVPLYETMFSAEETSFMKFMDINGARIPIYMDAGGDESLRMAVVKNIRHGSLRFIRSMRAAFGTSAHEVDIGHEKSLKTLATFFARPSITDARILQGVAFEDAYGGGRGTILLANKRMVGEVWKAGREVLDADAERAEANNSHSNGVVTGGTMFNANALHTGIGIRERSSYMVPEGSSDGMLCYGPYRKFAKGKWIGIFVFHADAQRLCSMYMEVVVGQSRILTRQSLAAKLIHGTQSLYIDFEVPDTEETLEFRVRIKNANSVSGLKLLSVSAFPSPDKIATTKKLRNKIFRAFKK
ncbi:hypothetical protein GCM10009093_05560 [Brevundimonas terrae]|uniref:HAD family hydrolase n=2 Tax=Brevundimonas terrae TaxID=363631 RepID=A0ABP3HV14_9CAUL